MKKIILLMLIVFTIPCRAQLLKKLGKKAEQAAERTVERRVEKEASKKTDQALDSVFGTGENKPKKEKSTKKEDVANIGSNENKSGSKKTNQDIVSRSSFFPNGDVIFEETFKEDTQGNFPANWETNSGGEIILVNGNKALKLYPNSLCITNMKLLPENYALDFDFITGNLDYKELSGSEFMVQFVKENKLNKDLKQRAEFHFSLWQGSALPRKIFVENFGVANKIKNSIDFDMNTKFNKSVHVTCVVNGKRLRVYMDNEKVIDLPSFLQDGLGRYIQFYLKGTKPQLNHIVAISNIKITEEGEDIRSLILKGGFSTTKILFDSGSDKIKNESFSYLDKIGNVLKGDTSIKLKIIGHTDSDGDTKANLGLSQKRAASVKKYLLEHFKIAEASIQTDGKGESEPIANNATSEGKAQNRRVEFKKL
ncbi:OmpA family protein [Mariniflexile gromovii]|uniref:OmpA family protein n=1 Tax=Mariniflexile gromovii TaxID=362523 RepID=A0ABS4BTJ6_9FLAO|nr:OmpA family protein [Mariniflexile gromovii]MBP0903916.1 OmpA family protein [Mariniflexile gromovii]